MNNEMSEDELHAAAIASVDKYWDDNLRISGMEADHWVARFFRELLTLEYKAGYRQAMRSDAYRKGWEEGSKATHESAMRAIGAAK